LTYLDELNGVQRQAVTQINGPVMVIAGPGSGKTRVLTYRIAHIIDRGIPAENILSLTFTNKAAKEMKERIAKVVGPKVHKVWAGTFHSIFAKILRIEAEKIGYPSHFTIYDADDSKNLVASIIKEMGLPKEDYNPNHIRNRISSAKSNLITPKMYLSNDELMRQDRLANRAEMGTIYQKYMQRCRKAAAMDFDDLLLQTYVLFQNNPDQVLEKYRKKFQYLLVDEFQDTNYLQYAIIKKLSKYETSPQNICIVGDDAQSIYAFRGATIDNILNFEKDFPHLITFKLEQNYRSTPFIVSAANSVIENNRKQIKKTIWTDQQEGEKIKILKTLTDSEEGKRVSDLIQEVKNRNHIPNTEIAILYRTNSQSRVFEEFLRKANLPYRVYGGMSFYQRKEVKDLLAYFRAAVNPNDEEAIKRIVNYPKRGIGNTTLQKVIEYGQIHDLTLLDSLRVASGKNKSGAQLESFVKMMDKFHRAAQEKDAYQCAELIVKESGILGELNKDNSIEGISRKENTAALLDGVKEFTDEDVIQEGENEFSNKSLATYLQTIALLSDLDTQDNEITERITLMSVHSAKGLEFDAVFVVGMEEELFPSFLSMKKPEEIDEERRLFYVAITRARKFLFLTYAQSRYQYGNLKYNSPSRFLEEIDAASLENNPARQEVKNGVSGGIPIRKVFNTSVAVDLSNFKASPSSDIREGMLILHPKFGKGKVEKIDGSPLNRVATIFFESLDSDAQKRIMLKFAKLQILEQPE
jgi:DNA helicase-2/ATP-dependent DNA helicase PcrA